MVHIMDHFETALMCVIWKDLLQKIDIVNKALQEPGIELCTVIKLYDSLITHFHEARSKFVMFESMPRISHNPITKNVHNANEFESDLTKKSWIILIRV